MRRVHFFFLASGLALLAAAPAAASAQDAPPMSEYRVRLMDGASAHFGALRAIVGGDVDLGAHAAHHARAIDALATMFGDVFPEGSGGEGTRALPEIWTQPDDFQEKLEAFQSAAAALNAAGEAMDDAALGDAVGALGQSCRGCHTEYRADAN